MLQNNIITAPCENVSSPHGLGIKPFSIGAFILNEMEDIWKDVSGYEGLYQVSCSGLIRSIDKIINGCNYKPRRIIGKILTPYISLNGYLTITLSKNNVLKNHRLHRIIAKAFLSNPQNLPEINHKNENKRDNNITNLEWCTKLYNIRYGNGISKRSKLNTNQVFSILKDGRTLKEIAKDYNVHFTTISQIKRRIIYKQVLLTN